MLRVLVLLGLCMAGCSEGPFVPPPPPDLYKVPLDFASARPDGGVFDAAVDRSVPPLDAASRD